MAPQREDPGFRPIGSLTTPILPSRAVMGGTPHGSPPSENSSTRTTPARAPSPPIGINRGEPGFFGARSSNVGDQRSTLVRVDASLLASLERLLNCKISIGPLDRLSDGEPIFGGYEIDGPIDDSRVGEAVALIDSAFAQPPEGKAARLDMQEKISKQLARLTMKTRSRDTGQVDLRFKLAVYAEDLCEFPASDVMDVIRNWNRHFFPDFEELREAIEERAVRRRAMREAVVRAGERAQRERAERSAEQSRAASRQAWLRDHPEGSLVPEGMVAASPKPIPSDEYKPRPAAEIAAELDRFRMRMSQETPEEQKWLRQMEDLDVVDPGCAL